MRRTIMLTFLMGLLSAVAFAQPPEAMRMGGGMMVACAVFGLLLFIALLLFVILEVIWIKVWRQRLRNEQRMSPAKGV